MLKANPKSKFNTADITKLIILLFVIFTIWGYYSRMSSSSFLSSTGLLMSHAPNDTIKRILRWNPLGSEIENLRFDFSQLGCAETRCSLTDDKYQFPIEEYDAIIFLLYEDTSKIVIPGRRVPEQIYIMEEHDLPSILPMWLDPERFAGVFNWTLTYRRESDIRKEQIKVERYEDQYLSEFYATRNMAENKTGLVAWFVSNCVTYSGRDAYVEELKKFIPVDIYGKCGDKACPGNGTYEEEGVIVSPADCFRYIDKNYKFYLSFENSLCNDYITERFLMRISEDIIPIVYGLADYEHFAPPNSYIDATAFRSVEELANHIQYLDKNDTAYNEYMRWKKDFVIRPEGDSYYCTLCEKLHDKIEGKIYRNLTLWFETYSHCVVPETGYYYLKPT